MSRAHALLLLPALALAACTSADPQDTSAGPSPAASSPSDDGPRLTTPTGVGVVPGSGGALATATSEALYERAPVVVVAPAGDAAAQTRAASLAVAAGAPLLLSPEAPAPSASASPDEPAPGEDPAAEVERLQADTVVAVGAEAQTWAEGLDGVDVLAEDAELPQASEPARSDGLVVLAEASDPGAVAAIATARSTGAAVHLLPEPDPRGSAEAVKALSAAKPEAVLALGDGFGDAAQLERNVAVASTGVALPAGGQLVLPGKLYVALYGHPGSDALGVLGEQGVEQTVARAKEVAAQYEQAGSQVPVVPTFEIITTVASSALTDGDYSDESEIAHVRPLVEAAGRAGVYVVLDLQPGYDDFLTQAKMYEELLALPHVGLALDPEWRLKPGERHMRQIGRVSAAEVNSVVTWLADLTRDRELPQKMLLLHQFKTFMLEDRETIDVTRPELSVVTQMDGHGSPGTKLETWNVLRPGTPEGMRWGWKNFYDEDRPTLTPAQTLQIEPTPVFVSYQ